MAYKVGNILEISVYRTAATERKEYPMQHYLTLNSNLYVHVCTD